LYKSTDAKGLSKTTDAGETRPSTLLSRLFYNTRLPKAPDPTLGNGGDRAFLTWNAKANLYLPAVASAFAQPFSFGVVGGASLTGDFQNEGFILDNGNADLAYSTPKRWIAGGTAAAGLPFHLSFDVEALYHELEFTQALFEKSNGTLNSVSPAPVVTWEFPVLLKYQFHFPLVKPFIDAGPAFRSAGNLNGSSPSNHGLAVGLGVGLHLWKLIIERNFDI
jgi:hypothetical protein